MRRLPLRCVVTLHMRMAVPTMPVLRLRDLDGGQVQMPVPHAGLGHQPLGEAPEPAGRAAQQGHLQAVLVVEMDLERREDKIVMSVLGIGQALGEIPLVVVVDMETQPTE